MSVYIAIDGGTTNTRVVLIKDNVLTDGIKLSVGARKSIDGNGVLKSEIKGAIEQLLSKNGVAASEVRCVLASGMITSEFGLCHLEHLTAPVGISELHGALERVYFRDVTDIPFVFIRGVRLSSDNFEDIDVMRGEETELMGIISTDYGECIYILPGSHSKIIRVDREGRIVDFSTMLTGEMIGALARETILKDAVDLDMSEIDSEYLLRGYDYTERAGLNKALFKARVLKNFCGCGKEDIYSFFLGAVLFGEINEIIKSDAKTVVLGGKRQIRLAMAQLLEKRDSKRVITLDEDTVNASVALGAIRIFENSLKI